MNWFELNKDDESDVDADVAFFLKEMRRREEEEAKKNTIEAALEWLKQIKAFIRYDRDKTEGE